MNFQKVAAISLLSPRTDRQTDVGGHISSYCGNLANRLKHTVSPGNPRVSLSLCFVLFRSSPIARTPSISVLLGGRDLNLIWVPIEGHLQLAEGSRLHLVGVLQLLDPLGLLVLQSGHLTLDLHAFLILLVDAANQLGPLLLSLQVRLHIAHLLLLGLRVEYLLAHGLGL